VGIEDIRVITEDIDQALARTVDGPVGAASPVRELVRA